VSGHQMGVRPYLSLTMSRSQQWIFITDTVDAVYHPDDWFPEAMMDQLAEIAGNLPIAETRVSLCGSFCLPCT